MKLRSLSSKSLLFRLTSSNTTQSPCRAIAVFITNLHSSPFSTTSGSESSQSYLRRPQHHEESRSVRVSVWWDFQDCSLPVGANVFKVAQSITTAIRNSGIKGPITISTFGDVLQLPRSQQEALAATGISLNHVPHGGKNGVDRSLITDIMYWVSQNPPPAHLFLISNDKELASVLHRLRMSNYNILLASKSSASGILCSAATIMWDWDALIKGENVTPKHFNQPPDGPYNSWYGHYKIPLLDPFAIATTTEQPSCAKTEELPESESVNSNSVNLRPIPKEVVDKIRMILSLYPKGAPIKELRSELTKSNLAIDRDFYGHKKFSKFLLSMPDIFQITTSSDGWYVVHAVPDKTTPARLGSSPVLSTGVGKKQGSVNENEKHVKEEAPESSPEPILVSQKEVEANDKPVETNQVTPIAGNDSSIDDGFFQKLKGLWYGSPSSVAESTGKVKVGTDEVGSEDKDIGPGFLGRLLKSFKFWGKDTASSKDSTGNKELVNVNSQVQDIFAKESFWTDIANFINSPRGFVIVSHSRTRCLHFHPY